MKKRFIFFTLLLLTLIGGANWNVLNAQEQYRIKFVNSGKYLHVFNNNEHSSGSYGGVGVATYAEDNNQIFILEETATTGKYYIKSVASNKYIYCQSWNVDAYSTYYKSAIGMDLSSEQFYLMNGSNYFKVQTVDGNDYVFCNATTLYPDAGVVGKWVLEPVVAEDDVIPGAPTELTATEVTHNSVTLSWTAGTDALKYNVYRDGSLLAENIGTTTYKDETVQAETTYKYTVESVRFNDNVSTTHSNEVSVTTLEKPAIQDFIVGDGGSTSQFVPTYTYYNYSVTQQIYRASELDNMDSGEILKIAFYISEGGAEFYTRNIDVYMINTDKESFNNKTDWVSITSTDLVYSGSHTFYKNEWNEIELTTKFAYEKGKNIIICIDDNQGSWAYSPTFSTTNTNYNSAIYTYCDDKNYNPFNVEVWGSQGMLAKHNQIKFTWEASKPSVNVNTENIAFETPIRGGSYWTERAGVQPIEVAITPKGGAEVTNIELVDNSFFSIPADIDLTANPITFNVSTGVSNEAGTKTATLRITHTAEGEAIDIPVTAEVYMATEGDAIENPFEVTFDENGSYTYTITSLDGFYDDYIFSENEQYDANCPDVVFELTIAEGEKALVGATNANCWISRYDGFTPENGPASKHDYPETEVLSAGTYYFVLAPNSWALPFEFTLTKTTVPAPVVSYSNPSDGVVNQDNPMLVWSMNYADEYQVLLGTTNPPTDVVVDWTSELATSYQTENLQNNTQYFWQVNARNEAGTTNGEVYSFVTLLDVPAITSATAVNLYPGEATTITWEAVENVSEYKVYNGYELLATLEPTVTSYELSGLDYNMTGYEITVTATQEGLGESLKSNAIIVKVAGEFPLVVSVKDASGNPIEGATVTIDMTKAYDEFKKQVAAVEAMTTNAEGTATVTLPLIGGYDSYGTSWFTPYYLINISKYPYGDASASIFNNSISNNTQYTSEHTLNLPTIGSVSFDNEQVIRVGSDIVLKWSNYGVEGATAYNVYKKPYVGDETLVETVTTNELTITAEYDNVGSKYGVSAVFGDVETSVTYTSKDIYVLGNGSFYGYVIDGTNPISGLTVELSGTNAIGNEIVTLTTDAYGYFEGEILEGNDYTLTISHYDYEEVVMSNIDIIYGENDLETIVLTAKPSAEGIAVTATDNGEYANVTWTGSYEKYNVYRRNIENLKEVELLGGVAASPYTDNKWADLDNGTYQYGVSAFVEEQAQSRGTEVIFEEDFTNGIQSTIWNKFIENSSNVTYWYTTSGHNGIPQIDGDYAYTCGQTYNGYTTLATNNYITIPENAKLIFDYYSKPWGTDTDYLEIYVVDVYDNKHKIDVVNETKTWITREVPLSQFTGQNIKIWFKCIIKYGYGVALDNVKITGEVSSAVESQIVWSNEITKQGPATFEGTVSTDWNTAANWSTNEVPSAGANVIINANAVISSEVNVASLTINGTYNDINLTIADEGTLTVTGAINQTNYQLILEEGGQIFQNNADVTARFRMSIDNPTDWSNAANKDGWQFISMPLTGVEYISFATNYNPSTGQNTCDYDLYKFDGGQDKEWQNYKDGGFDYYGSQETVFKSGTGYLASRKEVETVTVSGTLNTTVPYAFQNYAPSFYNEEKELANFRLFGNPFTYDIYLSDFKAENIVNGYAVVDEDGNYVYRTTEPIKVGEGFFIQATDWTQFIYAPDSKGAKRESNNSLNVIASGKAGDDNVVINFGGYSEGFTKLQNFNENISAVFVANNGKRYGIANVNENTTEVELFFDAKEMGNYTIGIEPNGKFQSVTLVDRMTGIETNMLLDSYTFTATANDNPNRFVIRLANSQEPTANSNFVYQSGEELIVDAEGTIQIIDVMGRMVYSNDVESSNNRINVSNLKGATYIVRNISNNTVRTQKIVIL